MSLWIALPLAVLGVLVGIFFWIGLSAYAWTHFEDDRALPWYDPLKWMAWAFCLAVIVGQPVLLVWSLAAEWGWL